MKPVNFKHQNTIFAKDQPEYHPLPALRLGGKEGEVVSCWEVSFWERVRILFTGKVWVSIMTYKKPLSVVQKIIKMTQKEMFENSFQRPSNYFKLTPRRQWEIDENLGILDWEGGNLSPEEAERFEKHYQK